MVRVLPLGQGLRDLASVQDRLHFQCLWAGTFQHRRCEPRLRLCVGADSQVKLGSAGRGVRRLRISIGRFANRSRIKDQGPGPGRGWRPRDGRRPPDQGPWTSDSPGSFDGSGGHEGRRPPGTEREARMWASLTLGARELLEARAFLDSSLRLSSMVSLFRAMVSPDCFWCRFLS
jgi:hypothetical protein